jgi:hypothetical protein
MPDRMSLRELYDLHRSEPFPAACRGLRVEGHCLLTIDAHASACMAVFFQTRGQIGHHATWVLQEFHTDLSEVLERLGARPHRYLVRMHRITGAMLAHVSRQSASRRRPRQWWQMRVRGGSKARTQAV